MAAHRAAARIGVSAGQSSRSAPTPDTTTAPMNPARAAPSRAPDTRSPRNRVEPTMTNSGPVASSVTICQIGTPEAKP